MLTSTFICATIRNMPAKLRFKSQTLAVRIPTAHLKELSDLAAHLERTSAWLVRKAVAEFLERERAKK
jgi:predicted transcriptional regulator